MFRVLTPLLPTLIGLLVKLIGWIFATVFAPILCIIFQLLLPFLVLWGVIGIVLQILSGERVSLYKIYVALSKRAFDTLLVAIKLIGEFLIRLVVSRRSRNTKGEQ